MNHKNKKLISWLVLILPAAALIVCDQLAKLLAVDTLKGQPNKVLIPGLFELEYLENRGAAFGSFQGFQVPLIAFTLILLAAILWKYGQIPYTRRFVPLRITFVTLTAGAAGNLIDRIARRYVVDFFYFKPFNFPRFNVADCYIVLSVIAIAILILFVYKEEELAFLFRLKNKSDAGSAEQ